MPRYSEERKAAVLKKLLLPVNRTVVSVSAEEGISDVTLYSWLKQCRERGMPVPGNRKTGDENYRSARGHVKASLTCPVWGQYQAGVTGHSAAVII